MISILRRLPIRPMYESQKTLRRRMHKLLGLMSLAEYDLAILLTTDAEIQQMNLAYRGVDKPTDVLSFSQYDPNAAEGTPSATILGDVVISIETARRQTVEGCLERVAMVLKSVGVDPTQWSLDDEITFLALHGVLHLIGHDHTGEAETLRMESLEAKFLPKLVKLS
jgi:probable rRNA maturation factor